MSFVNPNVYICPICGMLELYNYEDYDICAYCGSNLIDTKLTKAEWGWYEGRTIKEAVNQIRFYYADIYQFVNTNRKMIFLGISNFNKRSTRKIMYHGETFPGCKAKFPKCSKCGSYSFTTNLEPGYWYRYINTCTECGHSWHSSHPDDYGAACPIIVDIMYKEKVINKYMICHNCEFYNLI